MQSPPALEVDFTGLPYHDLDLGDAWSPLPFSAESPQEHAELNADELSMLACLEDFPAGTASWLAEWDEAAASLFLPVPEDSALTPGVYRSLSTPPSPAMRTMSDTPAAFAQSEWAVPGSFDCTAASESVLPYDPHANLCKPVWCEDPPEPEATAPGAPGKRSAAPAKACGAKRGRASEGKTKAAAAIDYLEDRSHYGLEEYEGMVSHLEEVVQGQHASTCLGKKRITCPTCVGVVRAGTTWRYIVRKWSCAVLRSLPCRSGNMRTLTKEEWVYDRLGMDRGLLPPKAMNENRISMQAAVALLRAVQRVVPSHLRIPAHLSR